MNVEREGFELNAFHSGGRGAESIGGKEGNASDFARLVAGIMRKRVNQVGIFIQDFQLLACQRCPVLCFRIADKSITEVGIVAKVHAVKFNGAEVKFWKGGKGDVVHGKRIVEGKEGRASD